MKTRYLMALVILLLCFSCNSDDDTTETIVPRVFAEFQFEDVLIDSKNNKIQLIWQKPINIEVDHMVYDIYVNSAKRISDYQPLVRYNGRDHIYEALLTNLDPSIFEEGLTVTVDLVGKDLVSKAEETLNHTEQIPVIPVGNSPIDYGQINNLPFNDNENLTSGSLTVSFTVSKPSRLTINLDGFEMGSPGYYPTYSLRNLRTGDYLTHDGGVLGGGNYEVPFSESTSYTSPVLLCDKYELKLFGSGDNGTMAFNLSEFVFENLGLLESPYSITTANEFIFEVANTTNFSVYRGGPRVGQRYLRIMNLDSCEIIFDPSNQIYLSQLEPGEYLMNFIYNNITLVLNESPEDNSDINLGLIPSLPYNRNISVDFTYETDLEQKLYFDLDQSTEVKLLYQQGFTKYEHNLYNNNDEFISPNSSGVDYSLTSGSYYIIIKNSPYWLCGIDGYDCNYSIIQFDLGIEFN